MRPAGDSAAAGCRSRGGSRGRVGIVDEPPVLLPASPHPVQPDPLLQHAHPEALLEAAGLAGLATALVDLAVVGRGAGVLDVACRKEEEKKNINKSKKEKTGNSAKKKHFPR